MLIVFKGKFRLYLISFISFVDNLGVIPNDPVFLSARNLRDYDSMSGYTSGSLMVELIDALYCSWLSI